MSDWTVNGSSADTLGLRVTAGAFRTQGASTMTLQRAVDFDEAAALEFGDAVILAHGGTKFFQGKVSGSGAGAAGPEEGQQIEVVDAWQELEDTIYQEPWAYGANSNLVHYPRAVLGLRWVTNAWQRCTVGAQIAEVLAFAFNSGVDITVGSIPAGETMLPAEVMNASCAEVIRQCLRYHPDWIPWINHGTTPPTFNVTAVASLGAVTINLEGGTVDSFTCTDRSDMLPDSVRIVYEYASEVDGAVYRSILADKYPADGPEAGPRVISAVIPLAGVNMQTQKSRIQTRTIPDGPTATGVKAWLKLHFPDLQEFADDDIEVTTLTVALDAADDDTHPDAISSEAPRLTVTDASELPRELLRGQIEDWMRVKVGRVIVSWTGRTRVWNQAHDAVTPSDVKDAISLTATNATTKIYTGITNWAAAEDAPVGIAQATYMAIQAAMKYQGNVQLGADEMPATVYLGKKISLSNGAEAWATMDSPVHSVDFDVDAGTTRIGFGPIPSLAPDDFLEMQRMFRAAPVTWTTPEERASSAAGNSSKGQIIGGYEGPHTRGGSQKSSGNAALNLTVMGAIGGGNNVHYWRGGQYLGSLATLGSAPADPVDVEIEGVQGLVYGGSGSTDDGTV